MNKQVVLAIITYVVLPLAIALIVVGFYERDKKESFKASKTRHQIALDSIRKATIDSMNNEYIHRHGGTGK